MDRRTLTAIERWNLIIGIAMVVASLVFWRADVTAGVALGAIIGTANFTAIRWVIGRTFAAKEKSKGGLMLLLIVKMAALMAGVFLIIRFVPVNVVGFLVGISVFFVSIIVETIRMQSRNGDNGGENGAEAR